MVYSWVDTARVMALPETVKRQVLVQLRFKQGVFLCAPTKFDS